MAYHYQTFDNIFDIESLNNLYVDSHYFVAQHRIEIFYLCDIAGNANFKPVLKTGQSAEELIRKRVLTTLPELANDPKFQIIFYNLRNLTSLKRYFKLFGLAPNASAALNYMNNNGQIFPPSRTEAYRYRYQPSVKMVHHLRPVTIDRYNQALNNDDTNYTDAPKAYNVNFKYYPPKRTDPLFNPYEYGHGEMMGYNSANYDLTMVAHLMGCLIKLPAVRKLLNHTQTDQKSFSTWSLNRLRRILRPQFMRHFNDLLFSPRYKPNMQWALRKPDEMNYFKQIDTPAWYIYKGWKQTNRFLDISDFNRRIALKRLEATMGMQIKESSHVTTSDEGDIKNFNDAANVIAYNLNDVYATRLTFELPVYQDALKLRKILLKKFPALIYDYDHSKVKADQATAQDVKIAPDNLRFTRLNSDFSSAQFIIHVIAPYHTMRDIPGLNYNYPDPRVLKLLKQKDPKNPYVPKHPVNILDQTLEWCKQQDQKYHTGGAIAKHFLRIYFVYYHLQYHNIDPDLCDKKTLLSLHEKRRDNDGKERWICPYLNFKSYIRKQNTNVPYIKANGKPSSCLVTFSIGGIHGLEFNQKRYEADLKHYQKMVKIQDVMKKAYGPDRTGADKIGSTFILKHEGKIVATQPYVKHSQSGAIWRKLQPPKLFKKTPHGGRYILRKRYSFISVAPCQHEDFSGYYPMLISRLGLFWPHDQKTDTYRHLYIERLHLKHQLRKYTKNSPKWDRINLQQKLRKLLLNAASGAGAGGFTNNLRMNNAMVSMRIIGQLFAWRIGEAETLAGGRVPSTNTDGMYVMDLKPEINNRVLFKNVDEMLLDIVPSPLIRFVSKDANNRVEVERHHGDDVLTEARGSTLRSWQGPSPSNHLSHPAIADDVLARYLAYHHGNPSKHPFNVKLARKFIDRVHRQLLSKKHFVHALMMFQWVAVSNKYKDRFLYLQRERWNSAKQKWQLIGFNQLPLTNRLFLIKDQINGINHFIKIATNQQDKDSGLHADPVVEHRNRCDPYTAQVLAHHGHRLNLANEFSKAIRVTGMPDHQNVYLNAHRLKFFKPDECLWLYQHLDLDAYLRFIKSRFDRSWRNY